MSATDKKANIFKRQFAFNELLGETFKPLSFLHPTPRALSFTLKEKRMKTLFFLFFREKHKIILKFIIFLKFAKMDGIKN